MADLEDGATIEVKGSGAKPYILKNTGGVYSCTCPAWRNQSTPIERRTCKHLRRLRGDAAEEARLGGALPQKPLKPASDGSESAVPPLLLAETWDNSTDLSGWWMSEKLDGVRAYWDGRQFLSRLGNLFHAPEWFLEGLTDIPLDGELWIGRKQFQRTVSIVRRQDGTDLWKEVRFLVFDAPAAGGVFEDRMRVVQETLATGKAKYAAPLEQQRCPDIDSLRADLARVEALGGEGLMMRQPGSRYEVGRSATLLKVKSFRDAEAVVVAHLPGAGKHKGRLGAILVRPADGTEFSVGTGFSDTGRSAPPPIGSVITFRYQELSDRGVPRFPSYVGVRIDAVVTPKVISGDLPRPAAKNKRKSAEVPLSERVVVSVAPIDQPKAGTKMARHFEFVDGKSSKFWEVSRSGADLTTRWGRIGSAGQSKTKSLGDEDVAARQMAELIEEKTGEGYVEKPMA